MVEKILNLMKYAKDNDYESYLILNSVLNKYFNKKIKVAHEDQFISISMGELESQVDPEKVLENSDIKRIILE